MVARRRRLPPEQPRQVDLEDYLRDIPAFLLVENRPPHLREHAETSLRAREARRRKRAEDVE